MVKKKCIFLMSVFFLSVVFTEAGMIVVSGDTTPAFFLTDDPPHLPIPDNQTFFANVLGNGKKTAVLDTSINSYVATEINNYYNSLPGVSSVQLQGTMMASYLLGVDLLLLPMLDRYFTSPEVEIIDQFIQNGGSLFVMGDYGQFRGNRQINDLLSELNIPVTLDYRSIDIGQWHATSLNHPLTDEVTLFRYGFTAGVTGGTPLFYTRSGEAFVSVIVPEPATITLLGIGGLVLRRRKA